MKNHYHSLLMSAVFLTAFQLTVFFCLVQYGNCVGVLVKVPPNISQTHKNDTQYLS